MSSIGIGLAQVLALVGTLDDSNGEHSARDRFREFLQESVREVGQVRDYAEECLRTTGTQYSRALQDLVNHLGQFLGFEVTFGRYQGVVGQIGFDGHWISPTGYHIVVEVKTTEVYAVRTAALVGYVDGLISEQRIPSWENTLGLYVVGRPDSSIRQLENAIIAERRTHQLRVVSVESLLSLAEMMHDYDVTHKDVLSLLSPSSPMIDPIVNLMSRLVVGPPTPLLDNPPDDEKRDVEPAPTGDEPASKVYWLTPVTSDDTQTAEDVVQLLVGQEHIYAFGDRTPGRRHLKPGDWICFYAVGAGVIAHAKVTSAPEVQQHPKVRHPEKWRWVFHLDDAILNINSPVVIDAEMRGRLDAFRGREPTSPWAWFVQATRKVTEHDFHLLTQN